MVNQLDLCECDGSADPSTVDLPLNITRNNFYVLTFRRCTIFLQHALISFQLIICSCLVLTCVLGSGQTSIAGTLQNSKCVIFVKRGCLICQVSEGFHLFLMYTVRYSQNRPCLPQTEANSCSCLDHVCSSTIASPLYHWLQLCCGSDQSTRP